jgi:hypothetical protein
MTCCEEIKQIEIEIAIEKQNSSARRPSLIWLAFWCERGESKKLTLYYICSLLEPELSCKTKNSKRDSDFVIRFQELINLFKLSAYLIY